MIVMNESPLVTADPVVPNIVTSAWSVLADAPKSPAMFIPVTEPIEPNDESAIHLPRSSPE